MHQISGQYLHLFFMLWLFLLADFPMSEMTVNVNGIKIMDRNIFGTIFSEDIY